MTDLEIEHQRLTSGNAAAVASATEQLHGADAYAVRLQSLRLGVAQTHVALGITHSAVATASDANTWCEDTADYFIRH